MKVLLLSNTAGQGHQSTAEAVREALSSRGAVCRALDTYAYINPALYETLAKGYLISTSFTPAAYGGAYRLAELNDDRARSRHPFSKALNSMMAVKLRKIFQDFRPDVVVCTHVFSAQIVSLMKQHGQIGSVLIGIITDYTVHPFWQDVDGMDYYVVASELLTLQTAKKGIPREKVLPLGIPIRSRFSQSVGRAEARSILGIDSGKFTVLLMSGSMGHGDFAKTIYQMDRLDHDFQILAVCGNNGRAKRRIEGMATRKKVYSYGFVDNVDVMMDASDCIVTKPGGLTTSEALAKRLPIIMVNPIPGQEERNAEFMLNNGLAVNVTPTYPVDEALYQMFLCPEKLKNMQNNIRLVGKPNAAEDLCNFIFHLKPEKNGRNRA